MILKKFNIDEEFLSDVRIYKTWSIYEGKEIGPKELINILKGKDKCSSLQNIDHPEFTKLRNTLEKLKYIEVERHWWNGDRVLKPFILNGTKFKKGEKFPCGAAMKLHIKFRDKNKK